MSVIRHRLFLVESTAVFLDRLAPVADLLIRLWVANVFWKSGLTKIATWDSTLYLFEYEYAVPLLPTPVAATIATGVELLMPVLLVIGFATRLSASVLFVFNIVAVLSFSAITVWSATDHQLWGLLLLVTMFHGPGRLSVDHYLQRYFRRDRER